MSVAALVLTVVLLEVAISVAIAGPGQLGAGQLGPLPPFNGRAAQANTGDLVVTARITRMCLGPSNQTGEPMTGRVTLPLQNLTILLAEIPPGKGEMKIMTNGSGIAQSNIPEGVYSVLIGDLKVNRSLTLAVSGGAVVRLNLTSEENWTPSSYVAYTSAGIPGPPLPWTNVTAVFPKLMNTSSGDHAALIFGNVPSCSVVLAHPIGSYETIVGLLAVERGVGGVQVTFAAPASLRFGFDGVTMVTYTSKYGVQSTYA